MAKGLLLVMMEPPSSLEEEFNDWYDTEHFPQRRALPGFESASRWVCLDGWPRWIALYDLATPSAVETPEYWAVSGSNSTPWSRRVLPRTMGRERVVCRQVEPGSVPGRAANTVTRLVVARYASSIAAAGWAEVAARAARLPGLLQLRGFETLAAEPESWLVAEFSRVQLPDRVAAAFDEVGGIGARLLNTYAPYARGPGA